MMTSIKRLGPTTNGDSIKRFLKGNPVTKRDFKGIDEPIPPRGRGEKETPRVRKKIHFDAYMTTRVV